jgi:hypothetical protein
VAATVASETCSTCSPTTSATSSRFRRTINVLEPP